MTEDDIARIAAIEPRTEVEKMLAEMDAQQQNRNAHRLSLPGAATSAEEEYTSDDRTVAAFEQFMNLDLADLLDDDIFLV